MTKKFIALALLLTAALFVLCGCISQPYAEQKFLADKSNGASSQNPDNDKNDGNDTEEIYGRKIYVSGAVINDGYIAIPEICDYKTVLDIAGMTDYTAITVNLKTLVNNYVDSYIVDFICDGKVCSSINVNGAFITSRIEIEGVSSIVVGKLADYIQANGKITNRLQLKSALESDYEENYYKFYIDVADYA